MPAPYSAGAIFLQVVPSFKGSEEIIAKEGRQLARDFGKSFDDELEKSVSPGIKKAVDKGLKDATTSAKRSGKSAGDEYAGAFETSLKRAINSAQREVATIKVGADDKELQKALRAIKRDIKLLDDTKAEIGIDLDAGVAYKKLADIETNLRRLNDESANIDVRVNSAVALATIEKVRADLMSLSAIQVEPEIKVDRQMGAFERSLKAAVQGAIDDIGEQDVSIHATVAERDLAEIRRRLQELADKRIGIDIDADTAFLELRSLKGQLEGIAREGWRIDIDTNTTGAAAKLEAVVAAVHHLDGQTANIDVDVHGAVAAAAQLAAVSREAEHADHAGNNAANSFRAFNGVLFGLTTIGPAAIPVIGAIAGGLLALGPLAVTGAAGLGVMALGLSGVGSAVKALNQQQATAITQQQTYSRSVTSAARSVRDAEQGVATARESAARSAEDSERAVTSALRGVQDAERGVTDAQRDRKQAQEDLNRAIKDAIEQQEDLALSLRGSQLDEKEAALNLRKAEQELAAGQASGAAGDDLLELQLRVERYQLALDQAKERTIDLQTETDEFARTGVEGTDQVQAARQRLADADQRIADAQRQVADAQAQVAVARQNQDRAAADSARSVRDAQERLTDALQQQTDALTNVNSAQQKVTNSMAALSPAGRDFANFLFGLKGDFQELRYVAQEGFLPGLQDWMQTITGHYGPQLQRTIFNLSSAVGDMFSKFGTALLSKPFQDLFTMIENDGPRFIGYLGDILTNLGKGTASLIVAMEPLADFFGGFFRDASADFANWAAGLQGSKGLQEFFDYIERIAPKVRDFILGLGHAVANLAVALAPYGEVLLDVLTAVFNWIAQMDTQKLGAIVVGIVTMIGAMQTIFGLTSAVKSIAEAWRVIDTIGGNLGKTWGTFLGAAILLGGALFTLYQNSDSFRTAMDTLWHDVLEPVFEFIGHYVLPILSALTEWFTTQPALIAAIAAVFAGWKILTSVAGWLKGVRVEAEALNTTLGKRVGGMAGVGLLGAIGILGTGFAFDQHSQQTDRIGGTYGGLFDDLRQGGADADRARKLLGAAQNNFGPVDYFEALLPGSSRLEEYNAAHDAYTQEWNDMSRLEQAQSKVAEWTNTLADRQTRLGETSDLTAAAHRRLEYWTSQVRREQEATFRAASGLNQSLLEQQQIAIALADADIAYSQARDALDQSFQNYKDTLADVNSTEAERQQAEADWTNQSKATADAAAAVASARHQNADAALKESYANAALLIDLERQKEKYGELPPRLEELRASLAATVDPAVLAAEKMEELGVKVDRIPDSKTMVFDTEPTQEQIDLLESLGFKVEHLPNGTVTATAETQAAEDALALVSRDRTSTIYTDIKLPGRTLVPSESAFSLLNRVFGGGAGVATKNKARGGPIWGPGGPTSDLIPAWLSNGEYVIRAAAVKRYGLGFFDQVNTMRFKDGGLVPGFSDGGFAATWGGSIDLKGGDVSPLALMWVEAIMQINELAGIGAQMISSQFAAMRNAVLNEFVLTKNGIVGQLGQQIALMLQLSVAGNGAIYAENLRFATQWLQLTQATNGALYAANLQYSTQYLQLTQVTHSAVQTQWLQHGAFLLQTTNALSGALTSTWASMNATMLQLTVNALNAIGTQFDLLKGRTALPVNWIIGAVLNGALFPALNSISTTFGLSQIVPTAAPVAKLAAGGGVGGFSPSKTADNIPAWLTAGEFVQPVDTVDYYGADFMELLRRRMIPREMLPGFASGGLATWPQLDAIRRKLFPGSVMTSGYRPGSKDYHGAGMAIDIGVAGNVQSGLMPIAAALTSLYPQSAEIIHNPNASVKNGRPVPPSFWGAATWAQHANHVHWAMTMAQLLMGANPAGYVPGMAAPDASSYLKQLQDSVAAPVAKLFEQFGHSPFVDALGALPNKIIDNVWGKIGPTIATSLAATMAANIDGSLAGVQTTGPVQDIVRSVARQFGWDSGAAWNDLAWLIQHESGWRPTAQNPTSTAYGLFQFLNSTWSSTGIAKTSDPAQQSLAGMRYIKSRYGSPSAAKAFWQTHHWYSEGGPVDGGDGITPELMDTGGWIHPGLNVIMNKTGRPEPVINPATLDALISIGEGAGAGGGDVFPIQSFNGASAQEIASEIRHNQIVASRGGKY